MDVTCNHRADRSSIVVTPLDGQLDDALAYVCRLAKSLERLEREVGDLDRHDDAFAAATAAVDRRQRVADEPQTGALSYRQRNDFVEKPLQRNDFDRQRRCCLRRQLQPNDEGYDQRDQSEQRRPTDDPAVPDHFRRTTLSKPSNDKTPPPQREPDESSPIVESVDVVVVDGGDARTSRGPRKRVDVRNRKTDEPASSAFGRRDAIQIGSALPESSARQHHRKRICRKCGGKRRIPTPHTV